MGLELVGLKCGLGRWASRAVHGISAWVVVHGCLAAWWSDNLLGVLEMTTYIDDTIEGFNIGNPILIDKLCGYADDIVLMYHQIVPTLITVMLKVHDWMAPLPPQGMYGAIANKMPMGPGM